MVALRLEPVRPVEESPAGGRSVVARSTSLTRSATAPSAIAPSRTSSCTRTGGRPEWGATMAKPWDPSRPTPTAPAASGSVAAFSTSSSSSARLGALLGRARAPRRSPGARRRQRARKARRAGGAGSLEHDHTRCRDGDGDDGDDGDRCRGDQRGRDEHAPHSESARVTRTFARSATEPFGWKSRVFAGDCGGAGRIARGEQDTEQARARLPRGSRSEIRRGTPAASARLPLGL